MLIFRSIELLVNSTREHLSGTCSTDNELLTRITSNELSEVIYHLVRDTVEFVCFLRVIKVGKRSVIFLIERIREIKHPMRTTMHDTTEPDYLSLWLFSFLDRIFFLAGKETSNLIKMIIGLSNFLIWFINC